MMNDTAVKDGLVNLGKVEGIPHVELFNEVAKVIREDTMEYVDAHSKEVHPRDSFYTRHGKRWIDIAVSGLALLVSSPINLGIAACTLFDVGRPIMFFQKRIGRDGKMFTIVKFRNMTNATDDQGNLLPPDQRVTKFGKFVRKTSLDELLNFWSIFRGDMSLIGPRPLALEYEDRYCARHRKRYAVRPGLECPNIMGGTSQNNWRDQFENDIYYVENVSLMLDIKMVFALVGMVFNKKSTAVRASVARGSFMGYTKDGDCINSQYVPVHYVEEAIRRMENSAS